MSNSKQIKSKWMKLEKKSQLRKKGKKTKTSSKPGKSTKLYDLNHKSEIT